MITFLGRFSHFFSLRENARFPRTTIRWIVTTTTTAAAAAATTRRTFFPTGSAPLAGQGQPAGSERGTFTRWVLSRTRRWLLFLSLILSRARLFYPANLFKRTFNSALRPRVSVHRSRSFYYTRKSVNVSSAGSDEDEARIDFYRGERETPRRREKIESRGWKGGNRTKQQQQ